MATGESRTAIGAEAALVLATGCAGREMILELALCETECGERHENARDESTAGDFLAIATVALECHERLGGAFVTNRSTDAAAGERNGGTHRLNRLIGDFGFDEFTEEDQ